jgi:hypothetical protein
MKYVARFFIFTILMLCLAGLTEAQGAGVKKFPGETCTVTWTYLVADEANITGFRIYQSLSATPGSGAFTNVSTIPTARTVTLPATFQTGSVMYFYTVRAYFTGTVPTPLTVESIDSSAGEVDRNVVTPVGLTVK